MKIIVTISPTGEVKGDVKEGPGGAGCVSALLDLLDGLGDEPEVHKKHDYYRQVQASVKGKVNQ